MQTFTNFNRRLHRLKYRPKYLGQYSGVRRNWVSTKMLHGLHVLLVEDDFLIRLDLQTMLEDSLAKVTTVSLLSDGMAILNHGVFDIAVLDIRLTDGDVFPLAEVLMQADVPLVFHSGNAQTQDIARKFPGAIALEKPAPERLLIKTVRDFAAKAA